MKTTLVIPHPPYQATWKGRTEEFNRDLLALVGEDAIVKVDPLDPEATHVLLTTVLGAKGRGGCRENRLSAWYEATNVGDL